MNPTSTVVRICSREPPVNPAITPRPADGASALLLNRLAEIDLLPIGERTGAGPDPAATRAAIRCTVAPRAQGEDRLGRGGRASNSYHSLCVERDVCQPACRRSLAARRNLPSLLAADSFARTVFVADLRRTRCSTLHRSYHRGVSLFEHALSAFRASAPGCDEPLLVLLLNSGLSLTPPAPVHLNTAVYPLPRRRAASFRDWLAASLEALGLAWRWKRPAGVRPLGWTGWD